ncbi:MAG: radical SAM protein, partial [Candidatus Marinimicrobia bacterium]|nr:radical SAM protein [Candidatus Neomarinimicrobiota bacterium]
PNYSLLPTKPFFTVYSGHGCNWGKCRFCNSVYHSKPQYYSRPAVEIAHDFEQISKLNSGIKDVMLSSDSFSQENITALASSLKQRRSTVPYNIMLRGDKWVSEKLGELLSESGCTDVFIGAESLNDGVLGILNKGVNTENIVNAVINLSKNVKVILGLLLFIPGATEKQLDDQLQAIEKVLPMVDAIEPEILSVVQGSAFAYNPEKYGIQLWATERTINDSWCFGLSPDIPWTFKNGKDAEIWFNHYEKLKKLIKDLVEPHYWNAIDYVRHRF